MQKIERVLNNLELMQILKIFLYPGKSIVSSKSSRRYEFFRVEPFLLHFLEQKLVLTIN